MTNSGHVIGHFLRYLLMAKERYLSSLTDWAQTVKQDISRVWIKKLAYR